jgi:tartrate-resistant acid phosphatase type 5
VGYDLEMNNDTSDPAHLSRLIANVMGGRLSRRELIRRGLAMGLSLPAAAALAACGAQPAGPAPSSPAQPTAAPEPSHTPALSAAIEPTAPATAAPATATPATAARFAVIGDFGMAGTSVAEVSALVDSWSPDFIVSTGDNNYPDGSAETIDANIGQYYHDFIAPYKGAYGKGSGDNRFFPVLGNHDWQLGYPQPYMSYFSLPGNGRYYQFARGPLAFFMLDSMPDEPDGTSPDSTQGQWLQAGLAAAAEPWKVVVMHHPPFSSGYHGSSDWMQWPFAAWGARLVLAGHEHSYERIIHDGITYVVNGLSGAPEIYEAGGSRVEGSQIFYNEHHGAMLIEASGERLRLQFVTHSGEVTDDVTLG